ncbi:MAG: phosphoenolpyruvate carboxylase, partial [Pseudomonadales bacterium]
MSDILYEPLRRNVSLLGSILGKVISDAEGPQVLNAVERIRQLSKLARLKQPADYQVLESVLSDLDEAQLLPVARAFSQFLTLANIAEQRHAVSRGMDQEFSATVELEGVFAELLDKDITAADVTAAVENLSIDLVLTAHPTEIARRTLIHKYEQIDSCLDQLELQGRTEREKAAIVERLRELVAQIWHSQDFRENRPTPVDEAKSGFVVVENSLWQAVPRFLRRLDTTLFSATGTHLPIAAAPVKFSSWMGGDRDGNPNVTAVVTKEVLLLSRWQAADLYLRDLNQLIDELSMSRCNAELRSSVGDDAREPYREILKPLRQDLKNTLHHLERQLAGNAMEDGKVLLSAKQLWEPLHSCYRSLCECGMGDIAQSALLDTLRRVSCFGVHLVRHDIRQESSVHEKLFSELTRYLGLGDYAQWNEQERLDFLRSELQSNRPLIPANWQPEADSQELLDTCRLVVLQPQEALGAYVISMASAASDVLAVELLLKERGSTYHLPVVPLFETLDDLKNAADVTQSLLEEAHYRELIGHSMMVMIGYSDSAKDAGVLAAAWEQYRAQESLIQVAKRFDTELLLFHGRGGTIGRGGAPAHSALVSQPPGSLQAGLRVTEQGEMIRAKLGTGSIATKTLALYSSAILKANLLEPPQPKKEWRELMDKVAEASCSNYREMVRGEKHFVSYFRQATPEQELGSLPIGSRPSRRKADNSISSLRAIPWIFAWSQNRLVLPAWLGAASALQEMLDAGQGELLKNMREQWPFFATRLSMLEMVFAKSDAALSAYYDKRLVDDEYQSLGVELRTQLNNDIATLKQLLET